MKNRQMKKAQRELNKHVRAVNKAIINDNLWQGRFYITQASSSWYAYEDGSGGELIAILVCVDKKDGTLFPWHESFLPHYKFTPGHLFMFMNTFITEITDVYKNGNNTYKDVKIDYRNSPRVHFTHEQLRNINCWYNGR